MIQRMVSIRASRSACSAARPQRLWGFVRAQWAARFAALLVTLSLCACQEHREEAAVDWQPPRPRNDDPTVRVRIARNLKNLRMATSGDLIVHPNGSGRYAAAGAAAGASAGARAFASPVSVRRTARGFSFSDKRGSRFEWPHSVLQIEDGAGGGIWIDGQGYPGTAWLHATAADGAAPRFDVVNHATMESYLPGVLDRELFPHWRNATFVAQAIAARSYAMHAMSKQRTQHFDLEATSASQNYAGITANPRAHQAVRSTRGLMLTYRGQVLPAYYSSCCGGVGQDAALAFPNSRDAVPLRGRAHGTWCAQSRFHRWGPIRRATVTLGRRLASWGRAHRHRIAAMRGLRAITITRRNNVGRPAQFTITDTARRSYNLNAETFRHACNHDDPALDSLNPQRRLPSAHVDVTVNGSQVLFNAGRGHGHGVGMCQYGGEALAKAGYNAASILGFYYQGARIESVY